MQGSMTSRRPYLVRAMHEWINENNMTPYVVVDASSDNVSVPADYVKDGKIVLNVSFSATQNLEMGNQDLSFSARFAGSPRNIRVPIEAVLGIYAKESGQGMVFANLEPAPAPDDDNPPTESRKSHLKVVK